MSDRPFIHNMSRDEPFFAPASQPARHVLVLLLNCLLSHLSTTLLALAQASDFGINKFLPLFANTQQAIAEQIFLTHLLIFHCFWPTQMAI